MPPSTGKLWPHFSQLTWSGKVASSAPQMGHARTISSAVLVFAFTVPESYHGNQEEGTFAEISSASVLRGAFRDASLSEQKANRGEDG
jgi:hypothetical protein